MSATFDRAGCVVCRGEAALCSVYTTRGSCAGRRIARAIDALRACGPMFDLRRQLAVDDPSLLFSLAVNLHRVAGPWTWDGRAWRRPVPSSGGDGGLFAFGRTAAFLRRADAESARAGWVFPPGLPVGLAPECGDAVACPDGVDRPCVRDEGHGVACCAFLEDGSQVSASNAVDRAASGRVSHGR